MNNDNFILLIGESGSGKTSVANELYNKYGLSQVISYTTREKRTSNEDCHIFISDDEFDELEDLVAYTEYNGNRYGATAQQVEENYVYVIDPDGVDFFMEAYHGNKIPIVVYISVPEETRCCRLISRDGMYSAMERIKYDRKAFANAEIMADVIVENENLSDCVDEIYRIWKHG